MIPLQPDESQLEGHWLKVDGTVIADETEKRIIWLIGSVLTMIAQSEHGGWIELYVDKSDGRKWELTFPHSEWHGGGPRSLTCVSDDYVRTKYDITLNS